jgi:hypothetical protein
MIAGVLLRSFPHANILALDLFVAIFYGLLVLYVWRRRAEFEDGAVSLERAREPSCVLDDEFRWMFPPDNLRDAAAWDHYHGQHLAHGIGPQLADMFCDDRALVNAMHAGNLRSILCAGSGMSVEPRILAAAGFSVTVLDLSARALEVARRMPPSDGQFLQFLDAGQARRGGSVDWVAGDILDAAACPGPFDVVVERRTAQNYTEPLFTEVLSALAARLAPEGILFSHCHDGGWRPPANPRHRVGEWLQAHDWPIWNGQTPKPPGRVGWLFTSTG